MTTFRALAAAALAAVSFTPAVGMEQGKRSVLCEDESYRIRGQRVGRQGGQQRKRFPADVKQ